MQTDADSGKNDALSVSLILMRFGSENDSISDRSLFF